MFYLLIVNTKYYDDDANIFTLFFAFKSRCSLQHVFVSNRFELQFDCEGSIDSDHYLVKAKVRNRISMARTIRPQVKKINVEELKQQSVSKVFADTINSRINLKFQETPISLPAEEHRSECAKIIKEATETKL